MARERCISPGPTRKERGRKDFCPCPPPLFLEIATCLLERAERGGREDAHSDALLRRPEQLRKSLEASGLIKRFVLPSPFLFLSVDSSFFSPSFLDERMDHAGCLGKKHRTWQMRGRTQKEYKTSGSDE